MEFTIGAEASCTDGDCGRVSRLIADPKTRAVTYLVVESALHHKQGRLVPIDLVEAASSGIRLGCSRAQFERLGSATETELLPQDPGTPIYNPDIRSSLPMANLRLDDGATVGRSDAVPPGQVELRPGHPVLATDGAIGQIKGLVADAGSHAVTHVLLAEGRMWGHKQVAIPIGAVTGFGDVIRLGITKQDVADLPQTGT
jgi:uncharacterized protein YrrD